MRGVVGLGLGEAIDGEGRPDQVEAAECSSGVGDEVAGIAGVEGERGALLAGIEGAAALDGDVALGEARLEPGDGMETPLTG